MLMQIKFKLSLYCHSTFVYALDTCTFISELFLQFVDIYITLYATTVGIDGMCLFVCV